MKKQTLDIGVEGVDTPFTFIRNDESLTKTDIDSLICAVDYFKYSSNDDGVIKRSNTLLAKLHTLKETTKEN